jgi:hypothetical protein
LGVNPDSVSKVFDSDTGEPRVVYHGTNADFSVFDIRKAGNATDKGWYGRGFYFTPNTNWTFAEDAMDAHGGNANVMPVFLNIKKPVHALAYGERGSDMASFAKERRRDGVIVEYDHGHEYEGQVAEIVAFSPNQIKSATGNTGAFSEDNDDIRFSIADDSGRDYTPVQRRMFKTTGRDTTLQTIPERLRGVREWAGKAWIQGLFDQFDPIKALSGHAYALARLSKGASGAFEALLHHGKLSLKDGVYDADLSGGAIETVFAPIGKETTDFLTWVAGHRAERLMGENKENLFTKDDIIAAKSLASDKTDFDYTLPSGRTTRHRAMIYADTLRTFNAFHKNILDMAEQSGLIDGADRKAWEHEFYVPFYRVAEEDGDGAFRGMSIGRGLVRQRAFQRLKGGQEQLNDLLTNTLMNWAHLIDASAKNRAALATLKAAEKLGAAKKATVVDQSNVWAMENGKKVDYAIDDPYLLTALTALDFSGMRGPVMDALSTTKRWLTVGVTFSPYFKVRNLVRDSVQAIATGPGLSYNPLKNVAEGARLTARNRQEYVSALAGGGVIRFGTMLEGNDASRVKKLIGMGVKPETILDTPEKVQALTGKLRKALDAYNELGNRGEEINRLALYHQLMKQGKSHAEASLMARDLMDFSMQGSFTTIRFLTQVVPFLNARLQGLYKLGRAAKEDPARFSIVAGAAALASLALLAAYSDDDDWKKREDWDRDNYWWFKFGGIAYGDDRDGR